MGAKLFYGLCVTLTGIALMGVSHPAWAKVLTVTVQANDYDGVCDQHCSLADAFRMAVKGDTILLGPGTYALSRIDIKSDTILQGSGAKTTTLQGDGANRPFHIHRGTTVTMSGITLQGGSVTTSGGCILNSGTLLLKDSLLQNCKATQFGGAIHNRGKLTVIGTTLEKNSAGEDGGAILQAGTGLEMVGSTCQGNSAKNGGCLKTPYGQTMIQQSKISANSASEQGGGIWSGSTQTVGVEDTTIRNNNAPAGADCLGFLIFKGKMNILGDIKGCTTVGEAEKKKKPTVKIPTVKEGLKGSGIGGPKGTGTKRATVPKKTTVQTPAIKVQTPSFPKGTGLGGPQEKPKRP